MKNDEFSFNSEGKTREQVEAEKDSPIEKGLSDDDLQKALELNPVLNNFQKSLNAMADSQDKKSKATGTILKGMMETLTSLQEQVKVISGNSQGRKSAITSKPIDRFEKGEGEGEGKTLSMSGNRTQILDVMDNLTLDGESMNNDMAKAMTYFEGNNQMSPSTALYIEKKTGIRITE